jgi:hypothetical protein
MSKAKIVTLVCWLLTAVILIALCVWFLTGRLFNIGNSFHIGNPFSGVNISTLTGSFNEVGSYTFPAEGIDSLDIDWTAGTVSVTPYDGSDIKVTEYAQRDLDDREKLVTKVSGGTLEVDYVSPGLSINMVTKKLEILVPQSLAAQLDTLAVDATSADVSISDFTVASLDIDETSGEAMLKNIDAATADIGSVSGTIDIAGFSAAGLTMETTSGEMKLTDASVDDMKTNSVSGGHMLNGTFKNVDAGSVSGEIQIGSTVDPDKLNCESTSGSITVTLPGSSDLSVNYSTVSGRFNSEIAVKTSGGAADYTFSTVSGDITLKAA